MTDKEIAEFRRAKDRDRQRRKRRKAGVKPRKVYLAGALSQSKPWEAEGISRRTWERRRAKSRVASPSACDKE